MTSAGAPALRLEDCVNDVCPWSGDPVSAEALTSYPGPGGNIVVVGFCNPGCRDKFEAATGLFRLRSLRRKAASDGG